MWLHTAIFNIAGNPSVPDFELPLFERLEIETQSHCNRSCWFCPRVYDRSGAYLDADGAPVIVQMPTATIIDILDQAQAMGFDGLVSFHFYSEPLLDKRNAEFARAARARGMKPYLHTNGDVLKNNDDLCAIVVELYAYVVVGLYDYQTDGELQSLKDFWGKKLAGVDLKFSTIGDVDAKSAKSMSIPRALVPTDRRIAVPDLTFKNGPCHRPLIRMFLRYDGEMCFCCEDMNADFALGNINSATLEQLWGSDRHQERLADLVAGHRQKYPLCQNCPLSPSAPAPDGEKIIPEFRNYG
jgi:radical SAM protein with 4Fe4S-binding SPASM domain